MIQAILITVISVGAGIFMLNDHDEPPSPPPVEQPVLLPLAHALYWVGGCSVACSLIWGCSIVRAARYKHLNPQRRIKRKHNSQPHHECRP
ncbi:hypothetical protein [Ruficoccus sp. ZRK36]|uniref:hypothetical protein n=1 Tax=Ruficoccus sp. ZRK36 TaxID=2866311 RepID=UPI001C732547|nr:hypothetical protein [Ruficoccus sp. ZRK36]QYY37133.1 hypothetical protein K0V07_06535 [Ruficoccus sp. ZRK36]